MYHRVWKQNVEAIFFRLIIYSVYRIRYNCVYISFMCLTLSLSVCEALLLFDDCYNNTKGLFHAILPTMIPISILYPNEWLLSLTAQAKIAYNSTILSS